LACDIKGFKKALKLFVWVFFLYCEWMF
jgi:hypothetical protein